MIYSYIKIEKLILRTIQLLSIPKIIHRQQKNWNQYSTTTVLLFCRIWSGKILQSEMMNTKQGTI